MRRQLILPVDELARLITKSKVLVNAKLKVKLDIFLFGSRQFFEGRHVYSGYENAGY